MLDGWRVLAGLGADGLSRADITTTSDEWLTLRSCRRSIWPRPAAPTRLAPRSHCTSPSMGRWRWVTKSASYLLATRPSYSRQQCATHWKVSGCHPSATCWRRHCSTGYLSMFERAVLSPVGRPTKTWQPSADSGSHPPTSLDSSKQPTGLSASEASKRPAVTSPRVPRQDSIGAFCGQLFGARSPCNVHRVLELRLASRSRSDNHDDRAGVGPSGIAGWRTAVAGSRLPTGRVAETPMLRIGPRVSRQLSICVHVMRVPDRH